ncbi:MAG TPA: hypothetical protein VF168_08350 [Trueperaceae bacterium]
MKIRNRSVPKLAMMLALLVTGTVLAQPLSADEVLERVTAQAESLEDASFLLTGELIDPDGTTINLEVAIEVIPGEEVARATFYQPDALADNVIVFEDDTVKNYLFLTNQVTLFDANDPDALGGLLTGQAGEDEGFEFTLDLDALFAGWEASLESYEGGVYRLRMDNNSEGAAIDHAFVNVPEESWIPASVTLVAPEDRVLAELFVEEFERDQGLSAEDVTYLPEDAEVIDERN